MLALVSCLHRMHETLNQCSFQAGPPPRRRLEAGPTFENNIGSASSVYWVNFT